MNGDTTHDAAEVVTIDREATRPALTWTQPVKQLSVALGGTVFQHRSNDERVGLTLSHRFELFRVQDGLNADCAISWSTGAVRPADGCVLQSTEIWEARRAANGTERTVFYSGARRRPYLSLTFDSSFRTAAIVQSPESVGMGFTPELHPLSEYLTSRVLSWTRRIEVHASAALSTGQALLFVGHSGAGKTTISTIAAKAGAAVLSDDRVILGMHRSRPTAWGTPWHGSGWFTSAESGPLGGVFLLRHGDETRVTPLSYTEAVKHLFVRAIQTRVRGDEVLRAHSVLEEVLACVPAFDFVFRPTLSAFRIAERAIQREASP